MPCSAKDLILLAFLSVHRRCPVDRGRSEKTPGGVAVPVLVGVGEVISIMTAFKPKEKWTIGNGRWRILGDPSFSRINRERGAWRRLRKTGSRDRSKTRRQASQGWRGLREASEVRLLGFAVGGWQWSQPSGRTESSRIGWVAVGGGAAYESWFLR